MKNTVLALAFATMLLAGPALAQQLANTGRVNVEANEMEIGGDGDKATFRGNVIAARDGTTVLCETLVVNYIITKAADGTEKREVGAIDAVGGVTIKTAKETITASKATIMDSEDKLFANGNVKVVQGNNVLRGQKLVINLKTRKIDMSGGRVNAVVVP
jgi:lipopolysaccharide export system protein LptA